MNEREPSQGRARRCILLRGARLGEKRLVEGEEEKTKHACRVACPARLYSICTMPLWYSSISASSSFLLRPPQITSLPCRHAPSSSPRPRIPLPSPSHPCPRPLHSLPQSTSSQIIAARDEAEPRIGLDIFIHPSPALITGASSPTSMPPACRDIQKNFSVLSPSIYGILSIYFQGNLYQVRFCNNVICTMWYHLQELINLKFVESEKMQSSDARSDGFGCLANRHHRCDIPKARGEGVHQLGRFASRLDPCGRTRGCRRCFISILRFTWV